MSALLANLSVAVGVILAGISLVLAMTAGMAYGRLRHMRLLWIAVAFVLFAAQGALLTFVAVRDRADPTLPATAVLSLAIVVALYLAVLRR